MLQEGCRWWEGFKALENYCAVRIPICLPNYLSTFLPTYPLTCYLPTYLSVYLLRLTSQLSTEVCYDMIAFSPPTGILDGDAQRHR
ncbi:hypothetical protein P167DRAFT_251523 [Morchella conica CCBAS932]|uniref:Uncharacterized protein n=1 Tax=Morchella conica CCBAS932 TaxID=1392247 RepID=A0A3N4KPR9_9PEZI|nr:hypothetical protein P167DRAFT_251523 [Morchella conica CCBAS932]